MKSTKHLLFLVTIWCISLQGYSENKGLLTLENETMFSKILGQQVHYSVCLPEDYYTSGKKYPTVYMLHGYGDSSSSWLEYSNIDRWSKLKVEEREIVPMIYIMPEGYTNYYVNDFYNQFLYQDMFAKELVPHIDKKYRTKADRKSRGLIGYSMGGYGALILALNNQSLFSVTVPLSVSIRTDEQYMSEEQEGWNNQWGRLFGGKDTTGEDRLTAYYKENSPLHILQQQSVDIAIYLNCGDDENTLAYSNEKLHQVMMENNIVHQYRVGNGGHDFFFWNKALETGIVFISDSFEDKPYRGDVVKLPDEAAQINLESMKLSGENVHVLFPNNYSESNRAYPVLYFDTGLNTTEIEKVAKIVKAKENAWEIAPILVVFFNSRELEQPIETFINHCEQALRIREGTRFRTYFAYQHNVPQAVQLFDKKMLRAAALMDGKFDKEQSVADLCNFDLKTSNYPGVYIDVSDKNSSYLINGNLRLKMKDEGIAHAYRVRESNRANYLYSGLDEILTYINNQIHK